MSNEIEASCNRPSTTIRQSGIFDEKLETANFKEEKKTMIMVGKPAPTFTAPAFYNGKFTKVNLEDYKGKWVLLCFYPGDFTFV